jgi:beta-phosphoglucomutase-like phosphatase (HAD superfamily)
LWEGDRALLTPHGVADLKHEYTLSEEFRKQHFLVGLLLQETRSALNEIRDIRKVAIATLRNLLAKHSFDERYANKVRGGIEEFICSLKHRAISLSS